MNKNKWVWHVDIDGEIESCYGRGATSRFWITAYIYGKWADWRSRKWPDFAEDPRILVRSCKEQCCKEDQ